jgi:hypothetical protein
MRKMLAACNYEKFDVGMLERTAPRLRNRVLWELVNYQREWEGVAICLARHRCEILFDHFRPRFENGRIKSDGECSSKYEVG